MPPTFLYSRVALHWGFIVRQLGATAAQLAYVLPPPPTVVGAFMNPLARILGLSEHLDPKAGPAGSRVMQCALQATLAASAGLDVEGLAEDVSVGVVVHAEPSRITAATYKTGNDYRNAVRQPIYQAADRLLPVQASGEASSPGGVLVLAWLVDGRKLSECLNSGVSPGDFRAAARSVYRVGSREGIVSVIYGDTVDSSGLEEIPEGGFFESILYQPEDCVKAGGDTVRVVLYDEGYRERGYVVPGSGGPSGLNPPVDPAGFELRSGCAAYRPRGLERLAVAYRIS